MTATTFTQHERTAAGTCRSSRKSRLFNQNIYQVEVTGEDGEFITFEVMADSVAEASAEAEHMAYAEMVDIQYINITVLG